MQTTPIFYDIYDFYEPAWWTQPWGITLISLMGLLLVAGAIFLYIRRHKKTLLPWEWATQQLQKLSSDTCATKEDFKHFYFSLTTIIKHYFHVRYFWQTADKTDEELLNLLQEQKFEEQHLESIKKILSGACWIKFANEGALRTQAEQDKSHILEIIDATKPSDYKKKI